MNAVSYVRFVGAISPPGRVTSCWNVVSKEDGDILGAVYWHAPWRCYAFHPSSECIFEHRCLRDIAMFCEEETKLWRYRRRGMRQQQRSATALLSAIAITVALLAGCSLSRFPGINAARFPPPKLAMKCETVRAFGSGSGVTTFCHPDPDDPPHTDAAARLVYDPDGSGGWAAIDRDPEATPCLKHCDSRHPGCWGICERAGIDPRCPQQEAPPRFLGPAAPDNTGRSAVGNSGVLPGAESGWCPPGCTADDAPIPIGICVGGHPAPCVPDSPQQEAPGGKALGTKVQGGLIDRSAPPPGGAPASPPAEPCIFDDGHGPGFNLLGLDADADDAQALSAGVPPS